MPSRLSKHHDAVSVPHDLIIDGTDEAATVAMPTPSSNDNNTVKRRRVRSPPPPAAASFSSQSGVGLGAKASAAAASHVTPLSAHVPAVTLTAAPALAPHAARPAQPDTIMQSNVSQTGGSDFNTTRCRGSHSAALATARVYTEHDVHSMMSSRLHAGGQNVPLHVRRQRRERVVAWIFFLVCFFMVAGALWRVANPPKPQQIRI